MSWSPLIVGIGGTASPGSSTERALSHALSIAEESGARVRMLGSTDLLALPHYGVPGVSLGDEARQFVQTVRQADGLILASPGYHGSVSGLVKNGIDYLEETARDERIYLDGIPVGLIATAYGWQAAVNTLHTLRTVTHALRAWPTPLGVAINASGGIFREGQCQDDSVANQLRMLGEQVVQFARLHRVGVGHSVTPEASRV